MTRRDSWRLRNQPVTVCTGIDQRRKRITYTTMSREEAADRFPPRPPSPASWGPREWWLERAPLTQNKLLRRPWQARKRDLEDWRRKLVALEWPRGPWHPDRRGAYAPARVELRVLVLRRKLQDEDNRMASMKNLLDAIRAEGWLVDDSPAWLALEVEERKAARCRTVIAWRLAPS